VVAELLGQLAPEEQVDQVVVDQEPTQHEAALLQAKEMQVDQAPEQLLVVHIEVTEVAAAPANKAKTGHLQDNVLLVVKAVMADLPQLEVFLCGTVVAVELTAQAQKQQKSAAVVRVAVVVVETITILSTHTSAEPTPVVVVVVHMELVQMD